MQEDQPIEQLSRSERKRLKRLQRLEGENQSARIRSFRRLARNISIAIFVIGVIGFIFWWGITQMKTGGKASANVSDMAPDFSLPSTTGETITLSDFKGKKNVLLYFHEGLTCDPCMQQMPELEKYLGDFEKLNIVLLHVTFDPIDKLKEATGRYGIKTSVLSYNSAKTERDYDLTRFSMGMGRRAGHTFVLVGTDGVVKWRKDYWPGRGHMVMGGTMFVPGQEIVLNVTGRY